MANINLLESATFIVRKLRSPKQIVGDSWEERDKILAPDVNLLFDQPSKAGKFFGGIFFLGFLSDLAFAEIFL